jgi:hypothetical protein
MIPANDYQRFADECMASARAAKTDAERKTFLDLPRAWTLAAAKANVRVARANVAPPQRCRDRTSH